MKMQAADIKELSLRICDMVPDNPRDAITVLAINYAHVAVAAGCDDESAIEAVRRALKNMRKGDWWRDS